MIRIYVLSFRQQIRRASHVSLYSNALFERTTIRPSHNNKSRHQFVVSPLVKLRTLTTTSQTSSYRRSSSVVVNKWKRRTEKFWIEWENSSKDKNLPQPLQPQPSLRVCRDCRWWKELNKLARFWATCHPVSETSLNLSLRLVFEAAIPEYQLRTESSRTQQVLNEQEIIDDQTQSLEQKNARPTLSFLRNLLNLVLDQIRIAYKDKLPINMKDKNLSTLLNTSEMWAEFQRLGEIPNARSFTLLLSIAGLESEVNEGVSAAFQSPAKNQPLDPLIVLKYMMQLQNENQKPDMCTWTAAVSVWEKRGRYNFKNHTDAPYQADQILNYMDSLSIKPNSILVSQLLATWANMDPVLQPNFAEVAQTTFDRYYADICSTCESCHFHVIRAHCKSDSLDGAEQAYEILQKMIDNYMKYCEPQISDDVSTPDSEAFSSKTTAPKPCGQVMCLVISALAKHGADPEKVVLLLQHIHRLNKVFNPNRTTLKNEHKAIHGTLVLVIGHYARLKRPEDAERILQAIVDAQSYTTIDLTNSINNGHLKQSCLLAPSTQIVNACINAWAGSGHKDAPEKAESILKRYFFNGEMFLLPNTISFTTVMKAWARSKRPNAADRCEDLLRLMWKEYDSIDPASSKVDNIPSQQAVVLFNHDKIMHMTDDQMEQYKTSIKPCIVTYGTLMTAWSEASRAGDSRAPVRADAVYRDMLKRGIQPSIAFFSSFIKALTGSAVRKYAKSEKEYLQNLGNSARNLSVILREMQEKHSLKPDVLSYVICIDRWLKLCREISNIDMRYVAYNLAKSMLQDLVISLEKVNDNTESLSCTNVKKEDHNLLSSSSIMKTDDVHRCIGTFRLLIQTLLVFSSSSEKINLSQELIDIERMLRSTGITSDSLQHDLTHLNLRAETLKKQN